MRNKILLWKVLTEYRFVNNREKGGNIYYIICMQFLIGTPTYSVVLVWIFLDYLQLVVNRISPRKLGEIVTAGNHYIYGFGLVEFCKFLLS